MSPTPDRRERAALARQRLSDFAVDGTLTRLEPHEGGHINESWVASYADGTGERRFLLQHINRYVFHEPALLMENMVRVTRHVAAHLQRDGVSEPGRRVLALVPTRRGDTHHAEPDGEVWRLMPFIEGTRSTEGAETVEEAESAARAFGNFLRQLADLPDPPLHETIPHFHDTPSRLDALERAVAGDAASRVATAGREIEALLDRRSLGHALAVLVAEDPSLLRNAHNDAKVSNVLFDLETGEPLCVVDLDTVMPGLALHDFGDLVRSAVSDSAEDERNLDRVRVRVGVFGALARGFVAGAGDLLSPLERSHLVTAARVIVLEQAVRFLSDHLDGDPYDRVSRKDHNLDRARTQLRLLESLEAHEAELQRTVDGL
jgi:Phosphotransferase enzyme family